MNYKITLSVETDATELPTLENLLHLIKELRPYYEIGIRNIIVCDEYLEFGLLQIEFPKMSFVNLQSINATENSRFKWSV